MFGYGENTYNIPTTKLPEINFAHITGYLVKTIIA